MVLRAETRVIKANSEDRGSPWKGPSTRLLKHTGAFWQQPCSGRVRHKVGSAKSESETDPTLPDADLSSAVIEHGWHQSDQVWTKSAESGRLRPNSDQCVFPISAKSGWPISAKFAPRLARIDEFRLKNHIKTGLDSLVGFCQIWSDFGQIWPSSAKLAPCLAKFRRTIWPGLANLGTLFLPTLARSRPNLDGLGSTSTGLGPKIPGAGRSHGRRQRYGLRRS